MSRVNSPSNDTSRRRATVAVAVVVTVCCSLINISRSSIYQPRRSLFEPGKIQLRKTEEPMVILHIGPHKTATTTIQCDLSYYQHQLYGESNVAFLGRGQKGKSCRNKSYRNADFPYNFEARSILRSCDDNQSSSCIHREPVLLERHLSELSSQNKTVLISDEAFSRMSPKAEYGNHRTIFSLLDRYYPGRVKIVIVYRRYHDWIISKYNQENKPYSNEHGGYVPQNKAWPTGGPLTGGSRGARNAITFSAYYRNLQRSVSMHSEDLVDDYVVLAHSKDLHPVEYLRDIYLEYTDQIQILNLHDMQSDASDATTHFLRSVLPSITIPKDDEKPAELQKNPSRNFDFDILAIAAHKKGFTGKLSRPLVAKYAEKHLKQYLEGTHRELANPLPLKCLDDAQLDDFLKRTLEYERRLFPDKQSTALETSFQEADLKKKFCNLDAERLLSSAAVEHFFRIQAPADTQEGSYDYY